MRSRTRHSHWAPRRRANCLRVIRGEVADFQSAVLTALDRDQGDGLEQGYHTLNTLIEYGVEVAISGAEVFIQDQSFHRWTVELKYGQTIITHESTEDAITVLKEAFILLCQDMNKVPLADG